MACMSQGAGPCGGINFGLDGIFSRRQILNSTAVSGVRSGRGGGGQGRPAGRGAGAPVTGSIIGSSQRNPQVRAFIGAWAAKRRAGGGVGGGQAMVERKCQDDGKAGYRGLEKGGQRRLARAAQGGRWQTQRVRIRNPFACTAWMDKTAMAAHGRKLQARAHRPMARQANACEHHAQMPSREGHGTYVIPSPRGDISGEAPLLPPDSRLLLLCLIVWLATWCSDEPCCWVLCSSTAAIAGEHCSPGPASIARARAGEHCSSACLIISGRWLASVGVLPGC